MGSVFSQSVKNVEVGPIWNQRHAEEKAAEYVENHPEFEWTGHWNTTQPGRMSSIEIRRRCPVSNTQYVEVGPIWNQRHAEQVAADYVQTHPEFEWTGHWNTTIPGVMSEIQIERRGLGMPLQTQTDTNDAVSNPQYVEVGPIWNQQHAEQVAADYVRNHPECEWTGHWNTTRPGAMSVLQVRRSEETDVDVGDFVWVQQPNSVIPPASTRMKENLESKSDSLNSSAVDKLVKMFPETTESIISEKLNDNHNDVDKTVDDLLQVALESVEILDENPRPNSSSDSYLPTCPICWEAMKPPKRIFQCSNGHLVCEECRSQPELRGCPTCRQPIMGRATAMEQLLVNLQRGEQSKN